MTLDNNLCQKACAYFIVTSHAGCFLCTLGLDKDHRAVVPLLVSGIQNSRRKQKSEGTSLHRENAIQVGHNFCTVQPISYMVAHLGSSSCGTHPASITNLDSVYCNPKLK